jgi:molecular chaperone DnaK
MPKVVDAVRKLFRREPYKGVNPDEAVAVGAAIQASVLTGNFKELLLLDVSSMSLGVKLFDGSMEILIPRSHRGGNSHSWASLTSASLRNTPVPTKQAKVFTTVEDFTTTLPIEIFQGDFFHASQNRYLGKFTLVGQTSCELFS